MTLHNAHENSLNGFAATHADHHRPETITEAATESIQRVRLVELSIEILITQTKFGRLWNEGFQEVTNFLQSLPFTTGDFDLAVRRIENAWDYCRRGEFGAAAFELKLLRGQLGLIA